jgi:PAS domain S-box-containing protein
MGKAFRKTGIDIIGDVPWGTHLCQFYETGEDLVDILVPYFKAGLENNEFCMWITSEPLKVEDAKAVLKKVVKNLDNFIKKGQIEILDYSQWYTKSGRFEAERVLQGWVVKEEQAVKRGFDGLRLTGNTFWLEEKDWRAFADYEVTVDGIIGQHRMLAICTYFLDKCGASEVIDVVSNHEYALIKRGGKWEIIESAKRKRAGEALQRSESKYKTLVENLPQKIFLKDRNLIYISCNEYYANDLRIAPDDIAGKTDYDFYPKELAEKYRADDKQIMESGRTEEIEERYIEDGRDVWVHTAKTLVMDGNGSVIGILGIFWDITERKRAEEEMRVLEEQFRQSQRMEAVGQLAGGIAHDFNNILTIIKGYSQLSLSELKKNDPLRENIEEIQKASERAANLIHQLLAFSRRQVMEMRTLHLNTLLRDLYRMLRQVIGEDIELVTLLAEDLGRVKADTGQIEQVIMNLAVNARDAMPKGGKLTIEIANVELDGKYALKHIAVKPGHYVMLSMSDTGCGMTPEVKDRVFEPFFTTKKKGKGTGLGLSTVYGIVKQSCGNIWVYSEPGKGTTFKIYLPRVDEPLEELKEEVRKKELPGGSETIFVVEDNEEVRKLAKRILEKQGYKVLEASQGNEALQICEEHKGPIHMIVTDVVMPGMDGRELANCLKVHHPKMKVLYMSGYTDNAIVHHGVLKKGMNFIQKPFTIDGLASKVRKVLDK